MASGVPPGMSTDPSPRIAAGVLCGGASSRFGSDKAVAPAGQLLLGQRVVRSMREAGIDPVVAVGGSAGAALGIPTIADRQPGAGPLAALATVLAWAGVGWVVVAPCDLPLLTASHVSALTSHLEPGQARVAQVAGRPQPSLAVWPASWARQVQQAVDQGERAFRHGLNIGEWVAVDLPEAALSDADDPTTLARLLRLEPDGGDGA